MALRTANFKGSPITVEGPELKIGDKAPDFKLQLRGEAGITDASLADFSNKTMILSVVPSLDTGVCAIQTKKFNEKASALPDSIAILTISTDLPFAQGRFCGAEGVDKIQFASDHRDVNFGKSYGLLIKEGVLERCLARSIFVVAPDGILKHVEYVDDITHEPNYDAALSAASS